VDPRPRPGARQHRRDCPGTTTGHAPHDLHKAAAAVVLDHLADEQPWLDNEPPRPGPALPRLGVAEALHEGRDIASQTIDTNENGQAAGALADHAHDGGQELAVAAAAEDAAQPEPAGYGQGHRHPQLAADHLD